MDVFVRRIDNCNEVADKYIEYDPVIIFLDVLLLQRPAYRHILINSKFKGHWRLLLVLWLCDALTKLMQRKAGGSSPRVQPDHVFYSALELHFYQDYLLSATESVILFSTVAGLLAVKYFFRHRRLKDFWLEGVFHALTMSSMGRLAVVPALIWGESYSALGVALTHLFVATSNVLALTVVSEKMSVLQSAVVVVLGYGMQAAMIMLFAAWYPGYFSPSSSFTHNVTQLLHLSV